MSALIFYLLIGAVAGILSGLLGTGGGIIVVPSLIWVFHHYAFAAHSSVHLATGSSLATIAFISFAASSAHFQRRTIVWPILWRLLPGVLCGSVFGAYITQFLPGSVLKLCFGIFLIFIACRMAFASLPSARKKLPRFRSLSVIALFVGTQSGMLGTGAGSILVPYLTRCHLRMRHAAGTSIATTFPIAIAGTITLLISTRHIVTETNWSTGYVYWPATLSIALTSLIFAPIGVRLAQRLPNRRLKRIFSVVLLLTAGEMIWPSISHYCKTILF